MAGAADTDGDGLPELLGASSAGNRIFIVRSNFHPSRDMNHDGAVDSQDVLAFLNRWNAGC